MREAKNAVRARAERAAVAGRRRGLLVGTDVVIVFLHDVDRRLLRRGRAVVDPGVARDQVGLGVGVGALVLGHQSARTGIGPVVEQQPVDVLIRRVLVVIVGRRFAGRQVVLDLKGLVRLLLGYQL